MTVHHLVVQGINIACNPHPKGVYVRLFKAMYSLQRAVKIHGPRHARFTGKPVLEKPETGDPQWVSGNIRTFTRIDAEGDWFKESEDKNIDDDAKTAIRDAIKDAYPDSKLFRYRFHIPTHRMYFEATNAGGKLSNKQVIRMLEKITEASSILDAFGEVTINMVPDQETLGRILNSKDLQRLLIVMKPTNQDVPDGSQLEKRFRDRNLKLHRQEMTAASGKSIVVDSTLRVEAELAADNGYVEAKNHHQKSPISTRERPLYASETFDSDLTQEGLLFEHMASALSDQVRERLRARQRAKK